MRAVKPKVAGWRGGMLLLLLAGAPLSAHAEVEWKARRILLEPPAGAQDAVGTFEFVNRGAKPVRVADVQSGCGCTVAAQEAELVAPGGTGRVRATYHVGDRQGKQSVDVTVTTHEPEVRTHTLTLDVVIKEFVSLTPRLLYWRVGDELETKILRLSLANDFRLIGVESTTTDFAVVTEQTKDVVQLKVTPRDLWAKRSGFLKIKVAQPGQAPLEVTASVRIL